MSNISNVSIRDGYIQWMADLDVEDAVAGTITFKRKRDGRPVSERAASDAMRVFSRMLQCKAFGDRFKRGEDWLNFIAVNEGGREPGQKHPHVHFFVEVPEGWTSDSWIEFVKKKIEKIECFGSESVVRSVFDDGWLDYMFKLSDKKCFADSVDVMCLWPKKR